MRLNPEYLQVKILVLYLFYPYLNHKLMAYYVLNQPMDTSDKIKKKSSNLSRSAKKNFVCLKNIKPTNPNIPAGRGKPKSRIANPNEIDNPPPALSPPITICSGLYGLNPE